MAEVESAIRSESDEETVSSSEPRLSWDPSVTAVPLGRGWDAQPCILDWFGSGQADLLVSTAGGPRGRMAWLYRRLPVHEAASPPVFDAGRHEPSLDGLSFLCPLGNDRTSRFDLVALDHSGLVHLPNEGTSEQPAFGPRVPMGMGIGPRDRARPGRPDDLRRLGSGWARRLARGGQRPDGLLAGFRPLAARSTGRAEPEGGPSRLRPRWTLARSRSGRSHLLAPERRARGRTSVRAAARDHRGDRAARHRPAPGPARGLLGRSRQPGAADVGPPRALADLSQFRRPVAARADGAADPAMRRGTPRAARRSGRDRDGRHRRRSPGRAGLRHVDRPALRDPRRTDPQRRPESLAPVAPGDRRAARRSRIDLPHATSTPTATSISSTATAPGGSTSCKTWGPATTIATPCPCRSRPAGPVLDRARARRDAAAAPSGMPWASPAPRSRTGSSTAGPT